MIENRLFFLKEAFPTFEIQFADDFSKAEILNPNYDENIIVTDDEIEFTVFFSFQHCHLEAEEAVVEWIRDLANGNKFAIEFFDHGRDRFGGEIDAEILQDLTYEKLEQFTGYYGSTKLPDVADSFKIRSWDGKNNFDCKFRREANGMISIDTDY